MYFVDACGVARYPSRMSSIFSSQCSGNLSGARLSFSFRAPWNLSTNPFPCGWYGLVFLSWYGLELKRSLTQFLLKGCMEPLDQPIPVRVVRTCLSNVNTYMYTSLIQEFLKYTLPFHAIVGDHYLWATMTSNDSLFEKSGVIVVARNTFPYPRNGWKGPVRSIQHFTCSLDGLIGVNSTGFVGCLLRAWHPGQCCLQAQTSLDMPTPIKHLFGASGKIGTIRRRLAWPLRKDDTHKSRSVQIFDRCNLSPGAGSSQHHNVPVRHATPLSCRAGIQAT
jgi:hypothetical protein